MEFAAGSSSAGGGGGGGEWFSDPAQQQQQFDYAQQQQQFDYAQQQQQQQQPMLWAPGQQQQQAPQRFTSFGFELPAAGMGMVSGTGGMMGGGGGGGGNAGLGAHVSRFGMSTYDGEPPLFVELGVNFANIAEKTKSALLPTKALDPSLMSDGDIAGPFLFCFCLGFLLMLAGKLHFGYVFGFGVVGCLAMYTLLNLMTQCTATIEMHVVFSVLGYALLPVVFLASVAVIIPLKGAVGTILVPTCVAWCTLTATRFFEAALSAREQRFLIAYPAFLFFANFALITVF